MNMLRSKLIELREREREEKELELPEMVGSLSIKKKYRYGKINVTVYTIRLLLHLKNTQNLMEFAKCF